MKVHIKRLLPPESMFRNIVVRTSDGRKFKLGHLQEMELEVEDGGWVSFRLDLYHRKIHLDPSGQGSEVCIILRYAMRQGFLGIIDSFGNMLRADIVDKSVYEDGGKWLLSQTPAIKKYAVLDYVLVSLLALPFLAFLLYPVLHPGMAGRDFVLYACLSPSSCSCCFMPRSRLFGRYSSLWSCWRHGRFSSFNGCGKRPDPFALEEGVRSVSVRTTRKPTLA